MVLPLLLALAAAPTVNWLDPAAVRPQQRGVCITEWGGGERLEIPVVVLGVLDAPAPERTSILVRLADGRLSGSGVVAGMSGSPVYVDGRLLGAVAYGFAFAREPLAGVTPFALMREISAGGAPATVAPTPLSSLTGLASRTVSHLDALPALRPPPRRGTLPLAVAGLPLDAGFAERLLADAGMHAVPAGGSDAVAGVPEAGDMVAALLVWGDAVVAAGGTVTAREGASVWAFGHPFLSLGGVRLPAVRARVVAVQDSYQVPFKVFSIGQPFGTFVADRPAGMLAEVGEPPTGVPVRISVDSDGTMRRWEFRVAQVPALEPLLVTYLTNACLTARGAAAGNSAVSMETSLAFADGRTIRLTQAMRGADALARAAVFAGTACAFFETSPFPRPELVSAEIALVHTEQPLGAVIDEAIATRTEVTAGEVLEVDVRLNPYRAPAVTKRLAIRVPAHAAPGDLDLLVADGGAFSDYRVKAEAVSPTSFSGQLAQAELVESSATLVLALESREGGVAYPGASQPALPPSWAATLATGLGRRGVQRLKTTIEATTRWQAPYALEGAFRIPLSVRRPLEGR